MDVSGSCSKKRTFCAKHSVKENTVIQEIKRHLICVNKRLLVVLMRYYSGHISSVKDLVLHLKRHGEES